MSSYALLMPEKRQNIDSYVQTIFKKKVENKQKLSKPANIDPMVALYLNKKATEAKPERCCYKYIFIKDFCLAQFTSFRENVLKLNFNLGLLGTAVK